jgi:predicted nucleic acid-binding protein
MYLLDTNVVSERTKPSPDTNVRRWLQNHRVGETYLSVITLAELEQGIIRLGDTHRAAALGRFLGTLEQQFRGRILNFDRGVARHWSRMTALAIQKGQTLAYADSLIAATAQAHDLTLVTRNTNDFAATGVPLLNPFEAQP